jgi:lipopolysaccharide cholinephosphotransferase
VLPLRPVPPSLILYPYVYVCPPTSQVFHRLRQQQLEELLFDSVRALNSAGCLYWVDFGAALGLYRDGKLIPHDNDLDMVVLDPDWDRLYEHLQVSETGGGGNGGVPQLSRNEVM